MTTIYKCIKGFKDRGGDRARIGQEFVIREKDYLGDTILDRKSGRGSYIVIPTDKFDTYFQEVKKELGTPKKEFTTLHKKELKEKKELKNEFKVGDEVVIAETSKYYGDGGSNPKDTKGVVTKSYKADSMGFCYQVEWSDDSRNSYKEGDLVAYKEPKKELKKKKELVDDRLPIGTKVEILVDRPDGALLKKGGIVEILSHSEKHSYRLEGGWYVHKQYVRRASKPAKLPIGSKVRVLVDKPDHTNMMKGELGTIIGIINDTSDYTSYTIKDSKDGKYWAIRQEYLEVVKEEKSELKVGDRVKIAKTSEYYNASKNNPANVEGTITETGRIAKYDYASLDLEVKWDNGEENNYNPEDLISVTPQVVKKKEPECYRFTEDFNDVLMGVDSPLRVGIGVVSQEDRYQCLVVIDSSYEPVIEVAKDGRKMIKLIKKEPLPF